MKTDIPAPGQNSIYRSPPMWLLAVCCLLVLLLGLVRMIHHEEPTAGRESGSAPRPNATVESTRDRLLARAAQRRSGVEPAGTPQEIVAGKVSQFARNRREIVHAMARSFKVEVPAEVERFF